MESNRDEADKCLELAMKYVRQGNKEKAERFVRKAEKLFPSRRIQEVPESARKVHLNPFSGAEPS